MDLTKRVEAPAEEVKRFADRLNHEIYPRTFEAMMDGKEITEQIGDYTMTIRRKTWDRKWSKGHHRYEVIVRNPDGERVVFYRNRDFDKFFAVYLFQQNFLKLSLAA